MAFLKKLIAVVMFVSITIYADQPEVKSRKCKTINNVNVCNNLYVGGNEAVTGSVTANSFINSLGPLLDGVSNYAVLANQASIATGNTVLWAATPASNLSSGISFDATNGQITLPTGLFLVQYTVRFDSTPYSPTFGTITETTVTAQLQQTVAGVPTNISQSSIKNNTAADNVESSEPQSQRAISGYALVNVTSSLNNIINLVVTMSNGSAFIPTTVGSDANAQMVIIQLN